jgi:hypothetical protein
VSSESSNPDPGAAAASWASHGGHAETGAPPPVTVVSSLLPFAFRSSIGETKMPSPPSSTLSSMKEMEQNGFDAAKAGSSQFSSVRGAFWAEEKGSETTTSSAFPSPRPRVAFRNNARNVDFGVGPSLHCDGISTSAFCLSSSPISSPPPLAHLGTDETRRPLVRHAADEIAQRTTQSSRRRAALTSRRVCETHTGNRVDVDAIAMDEHVDARIASTRRA